jgi:mannose-6-phosphate isomerase-like protein (cupin superfamily)
MLHGRDEHRESERLVEVLQTSERSQTAMMTLASDQSSGKKAEVHEKCDQVLLILDGELTGEVGDQRLRLKKAT